MVQRIPKSRFKPQALKYFREVQETGRELVITERGQPVLRIVPYRPDPQEALDDLKGSVIRYDDPTAPVSLEDWESLE
jgi:prevent-host-death family protein